MDDELKYGVILDAACDDREAKIYIVDDDGNIHNAINDIDWDYNEDGTQVTEIFIYMSRKGRSAVYAKAQGR